VTDSALVINTYLTVKR